MEGPQELQDPGMLSAFVELLVAIYAASVAVILGAMSYVWSVARGAKRCAFDTRLKVEQADASVQTTVGAIEELKKDMSTGFQGIHERLDRHLDK
jgi:hypothetical protein